MLEAVLEPFCGVPEPVALYSPNMEHEPTEGMSDADAKAAIEEFLKERADAGVALAKAASNVAVRDGELVVIFDPALANAKQWALLAVQPFDTLAHFLATPLRNNTPTGAGLRSRIRTITTGLIDGTSGGNVDVASLDIG